MAEGEVMEFAIEEMITQTAEDVLMVRVTEVSELIPTVVIDDRLYKALYDLNSQIVSKLETINQVAVAADGDQTTLYLPSVVMSQNNVTQAPAETPASLPKNRRWGKYRQKASKGANGSDDIPVKFLNKKAERPLDEKRFKCGVCDFRAVRRDAVREHMKVHSDSRPYKCQYCAYTTKHKYDLPKHERLHTGERPYKCKVCGHTARSASTLAVHKRSHTGDKPYQCGVCDFKGVNRLEVKDHFLHRHKSTNSPDLVCPHCGFQGRTNFHLDCHVKKEHPESQPRKCPVCDFASSNESEMSEHVLQQHGLPKHACKQCKFICYDAVKLKEHAKEHQKDVAQIAGCELCDQGVQHSENDGPEPYRCEKCEFKSSKCYELQNHIKTAH